MTDFGRDLKCRPAFVRPFLLACSTRNPKFAGTAAVCLQRIVVANALPKEILAEVLGAFRECSTLGSWIGVPLSGVLLTSFSS